MGVRRSLLNRVVAAILAAGFLFSGSAALADRAGELLQELAQPDLERWQRVERQLIGEWSKSGSAAMDLLLQRGRKALQDGQTDIAIEHLTALIDHAPDFAEGWHTRATAWFQAGHYGPAMQDIGRTLALNPEHFGALTGLGVILEETGFDEKALAAFRAAHAIHPHQPTIKRYLERLERRISGRAA